MYVSGRAPSPGTYVLLPVLCIFTSNTKAFSSDCLYPTLKDVLTRTDLGELRCRFRGGKGRDEEDRYRKYLEDTIVIAAPPGLS